MRSIESIRELHGEAKALDTIYFEHILRGLEMVLRCEMPLENARADPGYRRI